MREGEVEVEGEGEGELEGAGAGARAGTRNDDCGVGTASGCAEFLTTVEVAYGSALAVALEEAELRRFFACGVEGRIVSVHN